METPDLTKVKHVGASRMKSLNDFGIITLEQLRETPIDKLAEIPTIGKHYAQLIKDAVSQTYGEKPDKKASETAPGEEGKIGKFKEKLFKQIKILKKRLKRMNEDFKPPKKKKVLESYNEFRKRSKTLINRIDELDKIQDDLSKKASKNIINRADTLNTEVKNVGKKIKKKKFQKLSREIKSFSKMLKKNIS